MMMTHFIPFDQWDHKCSVGSFLFFLIDELHQEVSLSSVACSRGAIMTLICITQVSLHSEDSLFILTYAENACFYFKKHLLLLCNKTHVGVLMLN
jgi:hypothetical protein